MFRPLSSDFLNTLLSHLLLLLAFILHYSFTRYGNNEGRKDD